MMQRNIRMATGSSKQAGISKVPRNLSQLFEERSMDQGEVKRYGMTFV